MCHEMSPVMMILMCKCVHVCAPCSWSCNLGRFEHYKSSCVSMHSLGNVLVSPGAPGMFPQRPRYPSAGRTPAGAALGALPLLFCSTLLWCPGVLGAAGCPPLRHPNAQVTPAPLAPPEIPPPPAPVPPPIPGLGRRSLRPRRPRRLLACLFPLLCFLICFALLCGRDPTAVGPQFWTAPPAVRSSWPS